MIAIAHQTESFARERHLRGLDYYLQPSEPVKSQKESSRALINMFKKLQARGAPVKVERIVREEGKKN